MYAKTFMLGPEYRKQFKKQKQKKTSPTVWEAVPFTLRAPIQPEVKFTDPRNVVESTLLAYWWKRGKESGKCHMGFVPC